MYKNFIKERLCIVNCKLYNISVLMQRWHIYIYIYIYISYVKKGLDRCENVKNIYFTVTHLNHVI
jgi:hypothetical protein